MLCFLYSRLSPYFHQQKLGTFNHQHISNIPYDYDPDKIKRYGNRTEHFVEERKCDSQSKKSECEDVRNVQAHV